MKNNYLNKAIHLNFFDDVIESQNVYMGGAIHCIQ